MKDPAVYLEDIERHADAAIRFISGMDEADYLRDDKTRAAVERVLEVCGEALKKLHHLAPELAAQIPHFRAIIGFRNILAHGYAEVDACRVYAIVNDDVPPLLTKVRELLRDFPEPSNTA